MKQNNGSYLEGLKYLGQVPGPNNYKQPSTLNDVSASLSPKLKDFSLKGV
jgi:hypothetical protein